MHRCSYLYESGRQCTEEAVPDSDFCEDHEFVHDHFEPLSEGPLRKLAMRLAALLLLLTFLIPFYYTLKTLYLSQNIEVQEAG
jgi:hypothetical protein